MLSHLSVGRDPERCLHFWRSFVDLWISPLHTKFHSPLSHSSELVSRSFRQFLAAFTFNPIHRLHALYAQSFRRTLPPPRLSAAAGTELAEASSSSPVIIAHSMKELYKRHCPSSLTRYCWIGHLPIVQDSPLLPPVGVRAVSQSQCG
ncbi:hypothetical protein KY285_010728 [Solanum tuberosum]|nr:hypothetical protein KY289_011308 [Solanum tuberosum]KAH0735021.1 hypothetical protein KY285_010728 [Solanum tuberosum]